MKDRKNIATYNTLCPKSVTSFIALKLLKGQKKNYADHRAFNGVLNSFLYKKISEKLKR